MDSPATTIATPPTPDTSNRKPLMRLLLIILVVALVSSAATYVVLTSQATQQTPAQPTAPVQQPTPTPDPTANWKTYTNTKHKFSLKYPADWKYVEVPTPTYQTQNDEIWFLPQSSALPHPQTDETSPVVLRLAISDPSINPAFVENYKSEPYSAGSLQGNRITGTSKAGFSINNIVINTGTFYITALTNDQVKYGSYLDQILSTFKFTQ